MMWQWCSRRSTAQAVMEPLGRMSSQSQNSWLLLARGSMFVMHKQLVALLLLEHLRQIVGRWNGYGFGLSDPAQSSAAADSFGWWDRAFIDLTPLSMSCRPRRHASTELSLRVGPLWPCINTGINWLGLSSGYCRGGQMSSALIGKRSLKWTQGWQWVKNHIAPSSQHPRRLLSRENERIGKANSQCPHSFLGCAGSVGRF